VALHPRSDWTTVAPANSNPITDSEIEGSDVHWNGPAVPLSALTDPRSYLEAVRRFHVNTNGWSDIAYNFAVDQLGDIWVLRGMEYKSAANGNADLNARYIAILGIIGDGQAPTPAMLAGIQEVIRMQRKRYPAGKAINGHGQIDPTSVPCPGPDLLAAIKAGTLDPEDDMPTAQEIVDALLSDANAVPLRKRIREALDAEFGDESGAGAFSTRVASKVDLSPLVAALAATAKSTHVDALATRLETLELSVEDILEQLIEMRTGLPESAGRAALDALLSRVTAAFRS
jgi:hypothetical protein